MQKHLISGYMTEESRMQIVDEANFFIKQFGNPTGNFGRFLSKIMNVSNKRMYRANSDKVSNAVKILEIGFGNGRQLQFCRVLKEINRVLNSGGIFVNSLNTMYAHSVKNNCKGDCASDTDKLIEYSEDASFEVFSKQKISRNEEQVVFVKR